MLSRIQRIQRHIELMTGTLTRQESPLATCVEVVTAISYQGGLWFTLCILTHSRHSTDSWGICWLKG